MPGTPAAGRPHTLRPSTSTIDLDLGPGPVDDRLLHRLIEVLQQLTTDSPAPPAPETVRIHVASRSVHIGSRTAALTRVEFDLLLHLARHPRHVLTRHQLMTAIWNGDRGRSRTVDVHVRRLRSKVGTAGTIVETVRGVGYRLSRHAHVIVIATDGRSGQGSL